MATPMPLRALEFWARQYRRTWQGTVVTSVLTPVLFLAAMGLGLGSYVSSAGRSSLGGVSYLTFLAPGLLAANAMQTAVVESTWPVMGATKWQRTYYAQQATPLSPGDIWAGHLGWVTVRLAQVSAVFVAVMAAFGAAPGWGVALALPAAVLTGLAFAAPVMAYAVRQENETGFTVLFRFGIVPLFLFSGTFFPVSRLPAGLQQVAYLTPLWHGVTLCRQLSLGQVSAAAALGHVAYLGAWLVVGAWLARRSYVARLQR